MRNPKPLPMSQLKEKIIQLGGNTIGLENTLETEETKVRNLKEQKAKLEVKLATAEERVNAPIQSMPFLESYCAKEVHEDVPANVIAGSFEQPSFERVIGTQEGSVMAWSVAKNWLEGHWANVNEERKW